MKDTSVQGTHFCGVFCHLRCKCPDETPPMWRHFLCGAEVSSDEVLSIGKFKPGAAIFYQNNQDNIRINDILYHNQNYTSFLLFRVPSYKISAGRISQLVMSPSTTEFQVADCISEVLPHKARPYCTRRCVYIIISRRRRRPGDGRYCNAPRPSVCLSVRPSVCPSRLVFAL